jgi:transposase
MQTFLDQLSREVADNAHAIVIMDRAGWHRSNDLTMPDNLTPVFLPSYSPELNAIERLWLFLKERYLSHRLWQTYDDIIDAVCQAWNRVIDEPGRIKSLCSLDWAISVTT